MFIRRSSTVKYFIAAFVGAALYCEWFIFIIQPRYWPELECSAQDSTCTKILFIADPQIQGDLAVPPPLSYLFNFDSDRYLRSTFSVVLSHFKPDVLVYLGDLMDEGSKSTMEQFHGYVKRLSGIFDVDYPVTQVWIPGDNDIGGENESIKKDKVTEFDKVFHQPSVVKFRNVSFYKVNAITHTYPQKIEGEHDSNYKIVVSHYPITDKHVFGHQVNNAVQPNIYFCAHEHESKYVIQSKEFANREVRRMSSNSVLQVNTDENILHEIFVPTCSYRMGTPEIGYGGAILENNNQNLRYAVFWSPQRFPYLFFYLAILIILVLYFLVFCVARLFHRQSTSVGWSSDKVALLDRV